jgi:O-antigen/teichoic acid export membrane protein
MSRPQSVDEELLYLSTNPATPDARRAGSPSILRRVRRDIILLGAGNVATVMVQLGFRAILISILVPAAYGRLSVVLSVYNTIWIIGAIGLPSSVARYIAVIAPKDDSGIIRSAVRAGVWPTVIAAFLIGTLAGILLNSPLAFLFAAIGLSSVVYALLTMGILRGRGRVGSAASIMPITGLAEVGLLVILLLSGFGVTILSVFGVFCLGNVIGLAVGIFCTMRTAPPRASSAEATAENVPSSRQLSGFAMWLGAATVGIAILPLILRFAAVFDSYTVVAMVDVALVLFNIPSRMGAIIVGAVIPHAARAVDRGEVSLKISLREHVIVVVPFVCVALIVAFTPIIGLVFDLLGRPIYGKSADYLALVLLAGPARVLYGLVEGILVAHGEVRFLALNALSIAAMASGAIIVAASVNNLILGFIVFVIAFWAIYLCGLMRIGRLTSVGGPAISGRLE